VFGRAYIVAILLIALYVSLLHQLASSPALVPVLADIMMTELRLSARPVLFLAPIVVMPRPARLVWPRHLPESLQACVPVRTVITQTQLILSA
jgi:hypothetical protein